MGYLLSALVILGIAFAIARERLVADAQDRAMPPRPWSHLRWLLLRRGYDGRPNWLLLLRVAFGSAVAAGLFYGCCLAGGAALSSLGY
jgi:hypothetical protein